MGKSKIEWTDRTWNPVTGCTKVSQGCKNCYAERFALRMWGARKFTDIICHMDRLDQPEKWRQPQKVFVNSMSDLFHERAPFDFITLVYEAMARAKQHTFQILTKRPERALEYCQSCGPAWLAKGYQWPLPNVWMGISAEDQPTADQRIPILLRIPAAARFVSCEPLLGPMFIQGFLLDGWHKYASRLNWVIVGGESGPGARPMHPDWARGLRDQCQKAGTPFFFKQRGEWTWDYPQGLSLANRAQTYEHGMSFYRVGKKLAGRMLDGREWDEFPEVG